MEVLEVHQQEQIALDDLFNNLRGIDTPLCRSMLAWATMQCSGDQPLASKIYQAGIAWTHAVIDSGTFPLFVKKIGTNVVVVNPKLFDDADFEDINLAARSYSESRSELDEELKRIVLTEPLLRLQQKYLDVCFNEHNRDAAKNLLTDPTMVIIYWDHDLSERELFGRTWGMPQKSWAPVFSYAKMKEFPLTLFFSENEANSASKYVRKLSRIGEISEHDVWYFLLKHERVHNKITEPLAKLLLTDSAISWLHEALAIFYGDIQLYGGNFFCRKEEKLQAKTEDILKGSSLYEVNYAGSLEVWMAMSLSKDEDIEVGSKLLLLDLINMALSGKSNINTSQIPQLLLGDDAISQIDKFRPIARKILRKN